MSSAEAAFTGAGRVRLMENNLEKWQILCGQAAVEKDPERLMGLIREISQLLDERQEQIEKKQVMQEVSAQHRSLA